VNGVEYCLFKKCIVDLEIDVYSCKYTKQVLFTQECISLPHCICTIVPTHEQASTRVAHFRYSYMKQTQYSVEHKPKPFPTSEGTRHSHSPPIPEDDAAP
jgi:hypothetical protein